MSIHRVNLAEPRPFFAELPYYVWGQVNYDSRGDCSCPTDRDWTWLAIRHRETDERIEVRLGDGGWTVEGPDPTAARAAYFLMMRCSATPTGTSPEDRLGDWDHRQATQRAARVQAMFERPELEPFAEGHLFWGCWKWIGYFGTKFTWVGRWIMDSVLTGDTRAVNLCTEWLREGTVAEGQSMALRYALERLTGLSFPTDEEWVSWYNDGPGKDEYPEPDFDAWHRDLRARYGDGE